MNPERLSARLKADRMFRTLGIVELLIVLAIVLLMFGRPNLNRPD
jgi:hypothetical protein